MKSCLSPCVLIILFFIFVMQGVSLSKDIQLDNITLHNNKLFIDVKEIEISDLLRTISDITKVEIKIKSEFKGRITIKLDDVSIDDAIQKICKSSAIVYQHHPENNSFTIMRIETFNSDGSSKHSDNYFSISENNKSEKEHKDNVRSIINKMKHDQKENIDNQYQNNFSKLRSQLLEYLPADILINEILATDNSYEFRWLMADLLSLYPSAKSKDIPLRSVVEQVIPLLKDERDDPRLRNKVIAVLMACYREAQNNERNPQLTSSYYVLFKELTPDDSSIDPLVYGKALSGGFMISKYLLPEDKIRSIFPKKAESILNNFEKYDPYVVRQSMILLAKDKDTRGLDQTINNLYNTNNKDVFTSAAFSLSLLGGERIISPLTDNQTRFGDSRICLRALKDNKQCIIDVVTGKREASESTLKDAIISLGLINTEEARSAIQTRLNDRNDEIRSLANETLQKTKGVGK